MELQKSETREELLNNTINHFNRGNRGVVEYIGKEEVCVFMNQETGCRCAIGRELPEELAVELTEEFNGSVSYIDIYNKLPYRLTKLGVDFLSEVQNLHDFERYWDEDGLSMEGLRFVDNIRMKFDID